MVALVLQRPWVAGLAQDLTEPQVTIACDALDLLLGRLDAQRKSAVKVAIISAENDETDEKGSKQ